VRAGALALDVVDDARDQQEHDAVAQVVAVPEEVGHPDDLARVLELAIGGETAVLEDAQILDVRTALEHRVGIEEFRIHRSALAYGQRHTNVQQLVAPVVGIEEGACVAEPLRPPDAPARVALRREIALYVAELVEWQQRRPDNLPADEAIPRVAAREAAQEPLFAGGSLREDDRDARHRGRGAKVGEQVPQRLVRVHDRRRRKTLRRMASSEPTICP
jgi:hypothetical protein